MEQTEKDGISVIIPVYNAQCYLRRAVDSVLAQTYKDIELILVNDGSKDNSLEICREYEKKDARVVVIDKENGGVSSARNAGIERASLKYVAFMDNDDYMIPTYLEVMHEQISMDGGRDLLIADAFRIKSDEFSEDMDILKNDGRNDLQMIDTPNVEEIKANFTQIQMRNQIWTLWNMLFVRKKIIENNMSFVNVNSEDCIFSLTYIYACNSLKTILGYRGYVYILRNDSQGTTHGYWSTPSYLIAFTDKYNSIVKKYELKNVAIRDYLHNLYLYHIKYIIQKPFFEDTYQPRTERLGIMKSIVTGCYVERYIIVSKLSIKDRIIFLLLKSQHYGLLDLLIKVYMQVMSKIGIWKNVQQ